METHYIDGSDMADMKAELKAEIGSARADMADMKAGLKAENAEIQADIREIRQLLYKNVVGTGGEDNNGKKKRELKGMEKP